MLVRLGISLRSSTSGIAAASQGVVFSRFLNNRLSIPSFSALSSTPYSRAGQQSRTLTTLTSLKLQQKSSSVLSNGLSSNITRSGFSSKAEVYEFQAETRKLLDIVARSLYTDKEVFIRELISNASDALEKFRQLSMTSAKINDPEILPEISIETNEKENTISIQDTGIGMKKDDLIKYLGTIARSGSAEFMKQVTDSTNASNIIGQFGVGFYSTFMVGTRVKVYTKHAEEGSTGYLWTSDGSGSFEIEDHDSLTRGTKIVIELKEDTREFSLEAEVEKIVKKYSNFVGYTIKLNQKEINTVKAIWMLPKDKISEEDHKAFYSFITHAFDTPTYRLHYSTDTPVSINSIFYFPSQHTEKYNLGRMEPGVSLYSRKVLIQSHTKLLLPDWLRFVKGVVDSADIPLNLSREHLQDSALIRRLDNVLTRRILKFLSDQMKEDRPKYEQWWKEFGTFLKEGLCVDFKWKEELGKLLLVESSALGAGELTSLEEYVSRMKSDQKEIYWLCVPNRTIAETSPYYEAFKQKGIEVLFLHTSMDDFVMNNLMEYNGKKLVSIESAALEDKEDSEIIKTEEDIAGLRQWITDVLSDRVAAVKTSTRLVSSPALIVDHESANFRRMMKFVDPSRAPQLPKQTLEINPKHPIIVNLNRVRSEDANLAKLVVEQLFDNALIAAGLLDDPRSMISRLNDLMNTALEKKQQQS